MGLKIAALQQHAKKHETQRKAVQLWKEECKKHPGTCLVYEDFCNMYEANNAKMLNLVMVVLYWDDKKQECVQDYHDTFCRGSLYLQCWLAAFEDNRSLKQGITGVL